VQTALKELGKDTSYLGATKDILFHLTYLHRHHDLESCTLCSSQKDKTCEEAKKSTCEELLCNAKNLVPHNQLLEIRNTNVKRRQAKELKPYIHFGAYGYVATIMKSSKHHDELAKSLEGLKALEIKGSSLWAKFPSCLIIKGVCNYANSHKNKH